MTEPDDPLVFKVSHSAVAAFPREKFNVFLSNLKVQSKDYGLVPFKLLGSQRYVLEQITEGLERGITTFVILKARQIGMTTVFLALDFFWSFQHSGLLGTFILHKEEARDDWRQTIEIFYHEIPSHIVIKGQRIKFKYRKLHHNRNILSFSNGSRFRYLIAGTSENRRGGLGRSGAANFVHGTEVAFYGNEDDIRTFKSSTSSIYKYRMQIWESTANGFNHFYDTWEEAKKSETVKAIFVGWWRDERCAFHVVDTRYRAYMPDEKLDVLERQRVREVREAYGFQMSLQQISWYRWKRSAEFGDDQSLMDQEYPWTEDDAFQATGSKFFTAPSLTKAHRFARKIPFIGYRYHLTTRWEETKVVGWKDPRAELRVWEQASKFGYYCVGCDPAYGSSDEADRSVISVWRGFSEKIVQVAEFCSPNTSTYQCAWIYAHLCGYYGTNEVRDILELSGPGTAVWQELEKLKEHMRGIRPADDENGIRNTLTNMRSYFYRKGESVSGGDLNFHWRMTADLKSQLLNKFKNSFDLGRLEIRSVPLLEEMRRMVQDGMHIEAEGRHKDDRVIAAALAHEAWFMWQQRKLIGIHMTEPRARQIEQAGGEQPLDRLIINYLRKQNIGLPAGT